MKYRFSMLTEEDKKFICDPTVTAKEICERCGVGVVTPVRWRKKLGASVPIGSKKGRSKPWARRIEKRPCAVCSTPFDVLPSARKKTCSKKCYHIMLSNSDKSYMETEEYKNKMRKDTTRAYRRYANQVHGLSQKVYEKNPDIINPAGYNRSLAGVDGGYQLDHIIPINEGFANNIPAEEMCAVENLRMLPWKDNLARNRKWSK